MFTAVIIFQLVEEGKLALDQKLIAYFPDLPNADKITIAHLLCHRSGLHDYTEGTNYQEWMDKPATQDLLLSIVREKGADFEPGAKMVYCNTNFLLLGYIIEKKLRMPYAAAVQKMIVSKIGLPGTYYGQKIGINNEE